MKNITYKQFIDYVRELVEEEDPKLFVAYRKTALSDVQFLKWCKHGNSLKAIDDYGFLNYDEKTEYPIERLSDLEKRVVKATKEVAHKIWSNDANLHEENEISFGHIVNGTISYFSAGYYIKNILMCADGNILVDLIRGE